MTFSYFSKDGEEGFPGNLIFKVKYEIFDDNSLRIDYYAKVLDKPTVIGITNHSYFNLKGAGNGEILEHNLQICADQITIVD